MNALKRLRASLIIVLALVATMVPGGLASAAAPPAQGVRITPIGDPTWMPVDFHLFAATIGTATTGYGVVKGAPGGLGTSSLVECGVIRTRAREPLAVRLREIYEGVRELIARHQAHAEAA